MMSERNTNDGSASGAQLLTLELKVAGDSGPLDARLYRVESVSARNDSLIVFFHGGGFIGGDVLECDAFLRRLVCANPTQAVLATSYALAPARPFPAAAEDAYAVLVWARKNKARLGWNGRQLSVAGIEAGANLAAVATLISRDRNGPGLTAQILITPMLDADLCSGSMREQPASPALAGVADACADGYRNYLPHAADRGHPYASPIRSSRLKHLPPALIFSAQEDPLRDEAEQYAIKLMDCGVPTTVRRMPSPPLPSAQSRSAWACAGIVQAEITAFLDALSTKP